MTNAMYNQLFTIVDAPEQSLAGLEPEELGLHHWSARQVRLLRLPQVPAPGRRTLLLAG